MVLIIERSCIRTTVRGAQSRIYRLIVLILRRPYCVAPDIFIVPSCRFPTVLRRGAPSNVSVAQRPYHVVRQIQSPFHVVDTRTVMFVVCSRGAPFPPDCSNASPGFETVEAQAPSAPCPGHHSRTAAALPGPGRDKRRCYVTGVVVVVVVVVVLLRIQEGRGVQAQAEPKE